MRAFSTLTELGRARRLRPLALAALAAYDLEVTGLRLIDNGWNGVFRVDTAAGPLALRVTRPLPGRSAASLHSEVAFMTALAEATDIRVPAVIADRSGELITRAEAPGVPEPRSCVLFGWLPGPLLGEHITSRTWLALGELMGCMHRFAGSWTTPPGFTAPVYDSVLPYAEPLVMFEPGRADLLGCSNLLQEAYHSTAERIAALNRQQTRIVVHGDLHAWNVKVWRHVLSPFDFEDLLFAAPILDVATSLYYVRFRADYLSLAVAFRAGYERQQPWVESEPGELDRLLIARGLDLLNFTIIGPELEVDDWEAFIQRRESLARIALGETEPVAVPHASQHAP